MAGGTLRPLQRSSGSVSRDSRRASHPRSGVHVRSALVGGALLGTGVMGDPTDPFSVGTSDRAKAFVARSATDLTVGSHFFASFVARYVKPTSDNVLVAVHPGTNPFSNDAVSFIAQRKLGTTREFEFTPRYQLGRYFAIGAQYRYHHTAQAFVHGHDHRNRERHHDCHARCILIGCGNGAH